jgi:hypothetical protein
MPQQYKCTVCGAILLWKYNQEYNSNYYVLRLYVILSSLCSIRTNCGSIDIQDRQYAYKRNIEARSLNRFSRGKPINITFYGPVFVALVIHYPLRMRRIILSSVACLALPYFSTLIKGMIFGKSYWTEKVCFDFLYSFLKKKTFLIIRRIKRDIFTNMHRFSCKVPVIRLRL